MSLFLLLPVLLPLPAPQDPEPARLPARQEPGLPAAEDLRYPGETRFGTIRRLTTLGENAEGYFSFGGDRIVYQASVDPWKCDQIFVLDLLTGARRLVSTGRARTTCAYFLPDDERVLFASTLGAGEGCGEPPDYSQGYVWKIYPEHDLWVRNLRDGSLTRMTETPGYDAEATVSPDGRWIVFTSTRSGDLDLWVLPVTGGEPVQLTRRIGYDGGAFFSPDSRRLVWRAFYPETEEERERYLDLLGRDLIEPMALQIFVADFSPEGLRNVRQITDNDAANFAPYWHPDGRRIIFSSNLGSATGRDFNLFLVNEDGSGLEQVTFCPSFDGFPMFHPDGRRLIFASNRANARPRDTNLFLAEWLEPAVLDLTDTPAGR